MVRFTVLALGEHIIDNLTIHGPAKDVVGAMLEIFLATYQGPPDGDLDYLFAEHVINMSHGHGKILEYRPPPPPDIH